MPPRDKATRLGYRSGAFPHVGTGVRLPEGIAIVARHLLTRRLSSALAAVAVALGVASCGGGGSTSGAPPAVPVAPPAGPVSRDATASVAFTVLWPASGATASAKSRAYLSNATASVAVVVTSGGVASTPVTVDNPNLAPGTASAHTQSTTVTLTAPVGSDSFAVSAYDGTKGTGSLLGAATSVQSVVAGTANMLGVTLNGNLAKIAVAATPNASLSGAFPTYTVMDQTQQQFTLMPEDADGNVIIAPGTVPPLTLTSGAPGTISDASTATPNVYTIQAHGVPGTVTFTAAGTNLAGAPVTTAFTVATPPLYHPAGNGSTFAFSGSELFTYQRPNQYPTPEPTQTTLVAVAQTVTVTNPASYDGNASAVDFATNETDAQTAPFSATYASAIQHYYAFSNTIYAGNFLDLGFTSLDPTGYTVGVTYPGPGALADELPEMAGLTWTNGAAATITTGAPDGQTSSQTIAANGTYVETIGYQNVGAAAPETTTATITTKLDGSATYNTPRLGTARAANYQYSVAAPSADGSGTITATTIIPPAAGATPGATGATPGPTTTSTAVANWIPAGFVNKALATETDVDNGPQPIASPCPANSYASTANQIVQTKNRVDPMLGELEKTVTTVYDVANVGPVCTLVHDVETNYYDFSGQNGVGYFNGTPQQITTVDETMSLTTQQLTAMMRGTSPRLTAARGMTFATVGAQSRISALRQTQRARFLRTSITTDPGRGRAFASRPQQGLL